MYVYIIRLVTRDGYIIKHVCATPDKAANISLEAGHRYMLAGNANRVPTDHETLVKLLGEGKEFFLADTPDWSGDLFYLSRYAVE